MNFYKGDMVCFNIPDGARAWVVDCIGTIGGTRWYRIQVIPIHNGTDKYEYASENELALIKGDRR